MLHKLRIALAATFVALAAVSTVNSASAAPLFSPMWAPAAVMSAGAATALAPASTFLSQFWRMRDNTAVPAGLP
jgi:hypothetical protein